MTSTGSEAVETLVCGGDTMKRRLLVNGFKAETAMTPTSLRIHPCFSCDPLFILLLPGVQGLTFNFVI